MRRPDTAWNSSDCTLLSLHLLPPLWCGAAQDVHQPTQGHIEHQERVWGGLRGGNQVGDHHQDWEHNRRQYQLEHLDWQGCCQGEDIQEGGSLWDTQAVQSPSLPMWATTRPIWCLRRWPLAQSDDVGTIKEMPKGVETSSNLEPITEVTTEEVEIPNIDTKVEVFNKLRSEGNYGDGAF